jgi:translin
MINTAYLQKLKAEYLQYAEDRRHVIKHSDDALHLSKRAIFAMHRDRMDEAKEKLDAAAAVFKGIQKQYKKQPKMLSEGSYLAAVEEFVEASLFYSFLQTGKFTKIKAFPIASNSYLAGLCDVPGELYRYAIKAATAGDLAEVKRLAEASETIIGHLIEFNLTKYLRNKFDQAKGAGRKIEEIVYEVGLKQM